VTVLVDVEVDRIGLSVLALFEWFSGVDTSHSAVDSSPPSPNGSVTSPSALLARASRGRSKGAARCWLMVACVAHVGPGWRAAREPRSSWRLMLLLESATDY
jgi:hypothetical protein